MYVYPAQATPGKPLLRQQQQCFVVGRHDCRGQSRQKGENLDPLLKVAAREFPYHERVTEYFTLVQETDQGLVAPSEMVHPDRRIH